MKISKQWLLEWLPDLTASSEVIAEQLTMLGLEVDGIIPVQPSFSNVVVGYVNAITAHPDADKLRVCDVDVAQDQPLQIVCGAHNFEAGAKVPVALIGAVLAGDFKIKKSKLRGVESYGMICSEKELSLAAESNGIWVLPHDAPIGQDLADYLNLNDTIIDIDLTPNRGDCLSMLGIARELAARNQLSLQQTINPSITATLNTTFEVDVQAKSQCPNYVGRVIKNININNPSPRWLVNKLERSGMRSIDPVVDVTNYVMLELGQPLHAFDLDCLHEKITVRQAKTGETLQLLDETTLNLREGDLLIADQKQILALAGIMGGLHSGVSNNTKNIFLESAYFSQKFMAGRARLHGLHTESSRRFERGVDPNLQTKAIERATELLLGIVGGQAGPVTIKTSQPDLPQIQSIALRPARCNAVLGTNLTTQDMQQHLRALQMSVATQGETLMVTPPSYRFDMTLEEDLIEEIARFHGYNNITAQAPTLAAAMHAASETELSRWRVQDLLIDRGYNEAISYSFIDRDLQQAFDQNAQFIALKNPLSQDMSVMRSALIPSLLKLLQHNLNHFNQRVRLFEFGLSYEQIEDQVKQTPRLAMLASGDLEPLQWASPKREVDFFDLKADIETILALSLRDREFKIVQAAHPAFHPGQSASILCQDKVVGYLGAIHPKLLQKLDIGQKVFAAELDWQLIATKNVPQYNNFSKFPAIRRDLAILVSKDVTANDICDKIAGSAGPWLTDITLFDVYSGKGIDTTSKSLAIGIVIQHPSRTLRDEEVNNIMQTIINNLQHDLQATLRA